MQDHAILDTVGELVTLAGVNIEAALADVAPEAGDEELYAALEVFQGSVETIAMAAEMAQLDGLQQLCGAVTETLDEANGHLHARWSDLSPRLSAWNQAVQLYASQPDAGGLTEPLLALAESDLHGALWLSLGGTEAGLAKLQPQESTPEPAAAAPEPGVAEAEWPVPEPSACGSAESEPTISVPGDVELVRAESAEPTTTAPDPAEVEPSPRAPAESDPTGTAPSSLASADPEPAEPLQTASDTALDDATADAEPSDGTVPDATKTAPEPVTAVQTTVGDDEPRPELAAPTEPATLSLVGTDDEAQDTPEPVTVAASDLADDTRIDAAERPDDSEPLTAPAALSDPEAAAVDDEPADVLGTLLAEILSELEPMRAVLALTSAGADEVQTACADYAQVVERLQAVGMALGLSGLGIVCELMDRNVLALADADPDARTEAAAQLAHWPAIAQNLIESPEQEDHQLAVLELLMHRSWPHPLAEEHAPDLLSSLTPDEAKYLADAEERPTLAGPQDVALSVDPDVNPKLVEAFLQEGPLNAASFSARLEAVLRGEDLGKNLHDAQRLAHNLKGSANLLGIKGIANLTHHIEDILEYLDARQKTPQPALAVTLQEAADCVEVMIEVLQGTAEAPADAQRILQDVLDWARRMDAGQLDAPVASTPDPALPAAEPLAGEHATAPAPASETPQRPAQAPAESPAAPGKVLRVQQETVDALLRMVGEVSIAVDHVQEHIQVLRRRSNELQTQNDRVQQRRFALENYIDVRYLAGMQQRFSRLNQRAGFDPLEMDQYDELYTNIRGFVETVMDSRSLAQQLRDEISRLERQVAPLLRMKADLQRTVMSVRMETVESIAARLQRGVRQACRATGKQAELIIEGGSTALDSEALDRLVDPLLHILRNAVDHGIEAPEDRRAHGKPEIGSIRLRFVQEGQNVLVECLDDGRGLDYGGIRRTAAARGLSAETPDPKALARLILLPGFSTRTTATQVSGRGVGMDVVNTAIRELKGVMEIGDAPGGGCRIGLRLPITLMTSHSLLVKAQGEQYAIPTNLIARVLSPGDGQFSRVAGKMAYETGREAYPAVTLASVLGLPGGHSGELPIASAVVLIYADTGPVAVAVDQLMNSHHLVLKSLGRYVSSIRGVAGLSNLADGSLIPVLDLPELLRDVSTRRSSLSAAEVALPIEVPAPPTAKRVLVVDDSLSVRQSLSELMKDAGYQVAIARDGIEAVDALRKDPPDIVLSDIEMPRMNGLDLLHYIRTSHSTELPVIMITSRTMQKHRQQAADAGANGYVTKPFDEDALLADIHGLLS